MPAEAFPRGKGVTEGGGLSKISKLGDDQLFKTKTTKRVRDEDKGTKSGGKRKKNPLTGEEERVLAGRQKIGERGFDVQQLTFETITEGLLSLGTVSSIRDPQEVIVSLPGRTMGSIALADVNRPFSALVEKTLEGKGRKEEAEEETPSLSSIFFVGQSVCVRVEGKSTNKEGKTRVRLSSCPSEVNSHGWVSGEVKIGLTLTGALLSEGDKAWEVDTGINGIKAFLQKSKIQGADSIGDLPLCVGRLLFLRVDSCGGSAFRKTVQLSLADSKKEGSTIPDDMPLTYTQLLPGMSFREVVVMETHRTGIKVHLHDDLTGLLWQDHFGPDKAKGEEGKHKAQVLRGVRVLHVNPLSVAPTPYLTMQRKPAPFSAKNKLKGSTGSPVKSGDLVEVVVEAIQKRGVLVRCGQVKGIVPAGRLSDNPLKQADTETKKDKDAITIGQKRKCLIIGNSEWDELFVGSFQESLLTGKVITTAGQLKAGQHVKNVTVLNWSDGGALIDLTSGGGRVKAFLPRSQIPPSVKPLETKYPVGSTIPTVRVIEVNDSKCHVIVTALNALMKSKGAIVETYEEISKMIEEGTEIKTHGVVKDLVKNHGLTVRLLGGAVGFIPYSKMREERRQTGGGVKPGQVVEVKVVCVTVNNKGTRMILMFADDEDIVPKEAGKRKKENSETPNSEGPPVKKAKKDKVNNTKDKKNKSKNKNTKENQSQNNQIKTKEPAVPLPKKILRISEEEDSFDFSSNNAELDTLPFIKAPKRAAQKKKEANIEDTKSDNDEPEESLKTEPQEETSNPLKLSEEQLRQSLRINPRDGDAWVKLTHFMLKEAGGNVEGVPRAVSEIGRVKRVIEEGISALSAIESPHKVSLWAIAVTLEKSGSSKSQDTSDLVQKKLNEGMKAVDPVQLILKTGKEFERTKDYKNAESVYKRGLKMDETRVPSAYARMLYSAGRPADAANVFKTIVAQAKDPLKLTVEQGSLELQLGDKKKGLDLYNIVLGGGGQPSKMKKRVDLLSVMLNATIKYGSKDDVWSVFEKIVDMSIPPLRLRGLLKRMKEYEELNGTPESNAKFKTLAAKVVSS